MSDPLPPHFVPWRSTSTPPPEFWIEHPLDEEAEDGETSLDLWQTVGHERPWGTALFLFAWCATFAAMRLTLGPDPGTLDLLRWGGLPSSAMGFPDAWRWLAHTDLHGGVAHLASNGLVMAVLGTAVERMFTRAHFVLLFVVGALAGAASTLAWGELMYPDARTVTVGASAAVFALGAALLVGAWRLRRILAPSRARALAASILWLVVPGMVVGFSKPHVGNAAHVAGFAAGLAMGWALGLDPRLGERPPTRVSRRLGWVAGAAIVVCYGVGVMMGLSR